MSAMVGLGEPLPPGETHAVSVSLPKWDDIVDYEVYYLSKFDIEICKNNISIGR